MICAQQTRRYLFAFFAAILCATLSPLRAQSPNEQLLTSANAYNPIPSADGKLIAYVRTGWNRIRGSGGTGRSNLLSEVFVIYADGRPLYSAPLTDTFLSGWTPDSRSLVCYRDNEYKIVQIDGGVSAQGKLQKVSPGSSERVFYSPREKSVAWIRGVEHLGNSFVTVETPQKVIAHYPRVMESTVVPSPNGRYLAVFSAGEASHLFIYDLDHAALSDLGSLTIHPSRDWDYIQPTWDPWFSDSSRVAFFSGANLVIAAVDGSSRSVLTVIADAGLATPSPDGKYVAYAHFRPRPMNLRPDMKFWGASVINVVPVHGGASVPVTEENPATTYDLRWMGNDSLVFDRIGEKEFYGDARIWKVTLPDRTRH